MNSCILMAKIVRNPQLRYTQDNQLAFAEMMVEFENPSPNNPPSTLKVVAWGGLATDIEQKYTEGNQVVLTGRLKMDLVERQGYKEKIAELTISHIYPLGGNNNDNSPRNKVVSLNDYKTDDNEDDSILDDSINSNNLDNIPF
ncbi:single-stranded DNA-binding protein [Geminocystis sp. NIES-3708]|uniref:single-stranded DNA-binding protein n=1 Tax=Geminocystis sp. NIES-3708 TaxID=1615909 RepID=UPI0005FC92ED|nr:single-stranded DNA-binding protein [Geminocystis sp. NIES-3708]BAQ62224.1 single-stranded DNA-binding protein [Geminocystis sp. NIES-3708]